MIKIKSNEKLFNEFISLSIRVRNLSSIVQNDMEIENSELSLWKKEEVDETVKQLEELVRKVINYIRKGNKK